MPSNNENTPFPEMTRQNGFSCAEKTSHSSPFAFEHLLALNQAHNQAFLLKGLIHALKNPINSIQLASTLFGNYTQDINDLFDELSDEPEYLPVGFLEAGVHMLGKMSPVIRCVSDSADKLNRLVSSLAGFAEKGTIGQNQDVYLNQVVLHCASLAQHQICQYTSSFALDLQPDLPAVPGKGGQMTLVILNLLKNALISLHDRSCGVVISTSCDHAAALAHVTIRDNGCGISAEIRPHIFEPFFGDWQKHGCIGIGLTVARQLIHEHGGELSITSGAGKGTIVVVSLPLQNKTNNVLSERVNA